MLKILLCGYVSNKIKVRYVGLEGKLLIILSPKTAARQRYSAEKRETLQNVKKLDMPLEGRSVDLSMFVYYGRKGAQSRPSF